MRILLVLLLLLMTISVSYSQEKTIPTTDNFNKNYYPDITFLSEGESHRATTKNRAEIETAFRVIITTSEIYDNLVVGKATYGAEGGHKTLTHIKKIELEAVWEAYKLTGETAGLEFI
ncbi:hypothetical protein [Adhaeribacter pallidiroseus]|uniref:Uncharacterized protein n=1 Tax=Adhaeribacter pallidiroseus TaxID=2072847 RepID=A0A369QJF1_9BACT|nr:hypothetical protein [Adhaeribacter pallidiroseus]RDC64844.1 hypothetical protein AHMF7616_03465 [Adhaeribacter pallidiroseus]